MLTVPFVCCSCERFFHCLMDFEQAPFCAPPTSVFASCVQITASLPTPALGLLSVGPRNTIIVGPKVVGPVGSRESLSTTSVMPGLLIPLMIEISEVWAPSVKGWTCISVGAIAELINSILQVFKCLIGKQLAVKVFVRMPSQEHSFDGLMPLFFRENPDLC